MAKKNTLSPRPRRDVRRDAASHAEHGCPPSDGALIGLALKGTEADRDLARMAKALGHPARVTIVRYLAQQADCQHGDLAEHLPLAGSTISEHLRILKQAGIVRGKVDGPRTCYCIDPAGLLRVKALVDAL